MKKKEKERKPVYVKVSKGAIVEWDRRRIVDALLRETNMYNKLAEQISKEAEETIKNSRIKFITAPLIREVVNEKLIEHGLEEERRQHTRLGLPVYDVEQIVLHKDRGRTKSLGIAATNYALAGEIKKQYALWNVFSPEIVMAHEKGDIHIYGLDAIDTYHAAVASPEYVSKYGVCQPALSRCTKPPKNPWEFIQQLTLFSILMQEVFSDKITWTDLNTTLSPFLAKTGDREIKLLAHTLISDLRNLPVGRRNQPLNCCLDMSLEEGLSSEAKKFARIFMETYEMENKNAPASRPELRFIIDKSFFKRQKTPIASRLVEAVTEGPAVSIVMNRSEVKKPLPDRWRERRAYEQLVVLNLPRVAYESRGSDNKLFQMIRMRMELMAMAHIQKDKLIRKLLDLKENGPLNVLTMEQGNETFITNERTSFLFAVTGLNELVKYHTGRELHETKKALKTGLNVMEFIKKETERLAEKYERVFLITQDTGGEAQQKFLKLDSKHFSRKMRKLNKKTKERITYPPSTCLSLRCDVKPLKRIKTEGLFHKMIDVGGVTQITLKRGVSKKNVYALLKQAFEKTTNKQLIIANHAAGQ